MSALPITLFSSLLLATTFVVLFARDFRSRRFASAERDSLLPLADETPRVAGCAAVSPPPTIAGVKIGGHLEPGHDEHRPGHAHPDGACGCRDGTRPPCTGCLRRRAATPVSLPDSSTP